MECITQTANCSVGAIVFSVLSRLKTNVTGEGGQLEPDCLGVLENVSCVEVVVENYVLIKG